MKKPKQIGTLAGMPVFENDKVPAAVAGYIFELTPPPAEDTKPKNPVKGYAATPGSGPKGETCRTCKHARQRGGGSRAYWKCDLIKPTRGPGSDIRLKSPACWRFEKEDGDGG